MFDSSKIDISDLAHAEPVINYDFSTLKNEGFKLRYALNPKNPVYTQILSQCEAQNIPCKTVPIENSQEHIWLKEC